MAAEPADAGRISTVPSNTATRTESPSSRTRKRVPSARIAPCPVWTMTGRQARDWPVVSRIRSARNHSRRCRGCSRCPPRWRCSTPAACRRSVPCGAVRRSPRASAPRPARAVRAPPTTRRAPGPAGRPARAWPAGAPGGRAGARYRRQCAAAPARIRAAFPPPAPRRRHASALRPRQRSNAARSGADRVSTASAPPSPPLPSRMAGSMAALTGLPSCFARAHGVRPGDQHAVNAACMRRLTVESDTSRRRAMSS